MEKQNYKLQDIKQVAHLFVDFIKQLSEFEQGLMIAFYGDMGAGKTTFIKSVCEELGSKDTVTSPTFALINEYKLPTGRKIYHFDYYRINKVEEVYDMGYEEYFYNHHICMVEWPEKIESLLPDTYLKVEIVAESDESRSLCVTRKP